ncbi:MAG TPA: N-terminal phage integrase SAM-like domain-containing protein [Frankiaceae bacterium]|nr:N-terminal phage integrase SAM-like domain-containing protein [Frankiaceae bacterium]
MARPRSLPPGIRPRGNAFVYDWRDATGKTFSRKAGDTVDEAIAFKAKIDAELATGTFVAGSKTTFAEYAAHWIETHQLKSQNRRGYRSTLNAHLVPFFGSYRLVKITPALVREWYAQQLTLGVANNTVREHVAVQEHPQDRPVRRASAVPADDRAAGAAPAEAPAEGADVQAGVGAGHGGPRGVARAVRDRDLYRLAARRAARAVPRRPRPGAPRPARYGHAVRRRAASRDSSARSPRAKPTSATSRSSNHSPSC